MEPFSVSTELNLDDWRAYKRAAIAESRKRASLSRQVLLWVCIAAVVFAVIAFDVPVSGGSFAVGALFACALFVIGYRIQFKAAEPRQLGVFLGLWKYELGPAGIRTARIGIESRVAWSRISQFIQAGDYLYLWLEQPAAFVIPVRDLPPDVQREDAIARIKHWMSSTREGEESSDQPGFLQDYLAKAEAATAPAVRRNPPQSLFRLLTLRRSNASSISGSDGSLCLLGLLSVALWVVVNRIQTGPNAEFYFYNFPSLAPVVLVVLLLAWIFSRRSSPRIDFRKTLFIVLAFLPIAIVVSALIARFLSPELGMIGYGLLFAYAIAYTAQALWSLTTARQPDATIAGAFVFAGAWILVANFLYVDMDIWYDPAASNDAASDWRTTREQAESLLFDQHRRIDEAVAALQRSSNVPSATFFVGFAGVGEQKVFAEEIQLASKVVASRYGSEKTSVFLVNDKRDLETYPLATLSGLRYSLQRLAGKMDIEHDLLFLSLSSHGSGEPEIEVSNNALPLNNVSGEELASALDESGIKWRVIVISACHSGAFIPHLQNPNTIILTAAAADKNSFGCSDERDLTYFGEAFYRDALPQSKSLLDAFERAQSSIAKREKEEGVTPSEPQSFVGDEIRQAFKKL